MSNFTPEQMHSLLNAAKKAEIAKHEYFRQLAANQQQIDSIGRPLLSSMDTVKLQDLKPYEDRFNQKLEEYLILYAEVCKTLQVAEENQAIKKEAVRLYDLALKTSDFETALGIEFIKYFGAQEDYTWNFMGMAFNPELFDDNFKVLLWLAAPVFVLGLLLMVAGFIGLVLSITLVPLSGFLPIVAFALVACILGSCVLGVSKDIENNKSIFLDGGTLTQRFGFFSPVEKTENATNIETGFSVSQEETTEVLIHNNLTLAI